MGEEVTGLALGLEVGEKVTKVVYGLVVGSNAVGVAL